MLRGSTRRSTNNVAHQAIIQWMAEVGVEVNWTEDVNTLSGQLGPGQDDYKAVIFLSPTRDTLWKHGTAIDPANAVNTRTNAHLDAAKTALRQFMRSGRRIRGHPQRVRHRVQLALLRRVARQRQLLQPRREPGRHVLVVAQDPSTAGLPPRWPFRDEWYNLRPFPTKVKFLLTVDASERW